MAKSVKLNKSLLDLPNTLNKFLSDDDWIDILFEDNDVDNNLIFLDSYSEFSYENQMSSNVLSFNISPFKKKKEQKNSPQKSDYFSVSINKKTREMNSLISSCTWEAS